MPEFTMHRFKNKDLEDARHLCEAHFAEQSQMAENERLDQDEEPFTQNADTWQPIFDASNAFVELRRRYPALARCFLWFVTNAVAYRKIAQSTGDGDTEWVIYYSQSSYSTGEKPEEIGRLPLQLVYWCDLLRCWSWAPEADLRPLPCERIPPATSSQVRTSTKSGEEALSVAVTLVRAVIVVVSTDINTISTNDWLCGVLNQLWRILGTDPHRDDKPENEADCCERLVAAIGSLRPNNGESDKAKPQ
jgi:hypothetical protein